MPNRLQMQQFCMAKVKRHHFGARKPLNLAKISVTNRNVGGATAPPTVIGSSTRA